MTATSSKQRGWKGKLESFFRTFRTLTFTLLLAPIGLLYVICIGVSLTPGITLFTAVNDWSLGFHLLLRHTCLGMALATGFLSYGLTLIFVVPLVNKILPLRVRPHRTTWYSLSVIPWYYHNALTYLARYTFLDFITPTPLNKLFYQMMGMKVGKGTIINTTNISDPCLIEIGDYVTIGGSATLVAHYGMKGILIIDKLVIHDKAIIGMKATLFGDVVVGYGALVKANEVVMPKTRIPDRDESKAAA
ncbi:MAG TPA: hypothetical protein VNJ01_11710 [Bacteriovoracaceae bacterium]|nr:hypothetical protein [Bacteriovoracaceae bacterium]